MAQPPLEEIVRTPHKAGRLLIAPSYNQGSFDSHMVDCPFVFAHGGRFGMTFVGWDGTGYQTGLAWSTDLVHWDKAGCILERGPAGSVTEFNIALTGILRDNALFGPGTLRPVDGRFVGTWHAYPKSGYEAGPGVIGLAFSRDLADWEVGPPVLEPDPACSWEAGGLYKSWILEHDGTFYLFYNAKNQTEQPWVEQTGFATSRDLVHWERHPGNPVLPLGEPGSFDDCFASDPCILQHGDAWILFYFGLCSDGHARDGVAFSRDLIHWDKSPGLLVDVGPPGSVDSKHAHKPAVIAHNGRLHHFYCAAAPASEPLPGGIDYHQVRGITVATS